MPRANRHFVPHQLWHLTHRCHEKALLLKFARDRRRYLRWLFEAKKRFGLCVLNYMVTSNHIHLLVKDTDAGVISQSMKKAYALDFSRESETLTLDNTFLWQKK